MKKKGDPKSRTIFHDNNKIPDIRSSKGLGRSVHVNGTLLRPQSKRGFLPKINKATTNKLGFSTAVLVSLLTWVLRVRYVMDRNNWVSIHPDEVFQSMEVAHIELYGYGFRPYEFSSYFDGDEMNVNATQYRQMELDAGLGAMRSPIYPYYYVISAKIGTLLGFDANPYLIFRVAHVTITSLLPICVYLYSLSLFRSVDVATLATILTASSIHINVLGTHCLVQSFLSPFIFLTFALVVSLGKASMNDSPVEKIVKISMSLDELDNAEIDKYNNSCNEFHEQKETIEKEKLSNQSNHEFSSLKSNSDYPEYTSRISNPLDVNINHKNWYNNDMMNVKLKSSQSYSAILVGFLIGVTCYIRPDSALTHFVNICIIASLWSKHFRLILSLLPVIFVGLLTSFLFGVTMDTNFYGGIVVSPWNWFYINVIRNISSSVFGKMDFWFYFRTFYSGDIVICLICAFSVVISTASGASYILRKIVRREMCQQKMEENSDDTLLSTKFLIGVIFVLVTYSFHGHKEIRFIHDIIVLVIILSSYVLYDSLSFIINFDKRGTKFAFGFVLVLTWIFQWHQFYSDSSTKTWTYLHASDTQNTNMCLEFISNQPDVSGVFIEDNIFSTGSMTILHKDIPIFSRVMSGYFEFSMESRINATFESTPTSFFRKRKRVSVNTFTSVTNYVSQANVKGVLSNVLEKQEYNYIILVSNDQAFRRMGFQTVLEKGNRKVLKRVGDSASETKIKHVVDRLTLGDDVKVLVHEGDVLFHMRQFQKAAERFQHALSISSSKDDGIDAYLPLHECLNEMGHREDARRLMTQCAERHGKETCWKPRRITRLLQ